MTTISLLEDPLVQAFETAQIDAAKFRHREHLYVAWCYLRSLPFEDASARYVRALRQLTAALGAPQKFHATISWAYLVLLNEALERWPEAGFDELMAKNPRLLDHRTGAISALYERSQLDSDDARRRFVLPGRA
jgi:hypothetical protein